MIDTHKDSKSSNYIVTKTTKIESGDYHQQMTLTKEEMNMLNNVGNTIG